MSGYSILTGGHLPDGALLALIDGELGSPEAASHAASCNACAANLVAMRQAAERLRASLPPVTVPSLTMPRVTRRVRPAWLSYPAAVAATILLLASVATATPVRKWIARQFSPAPVEPTTSASPAPVVAASGITASFEPTDTLLVVNIATKQQTGAVHLVNASADRISVQALAGAASEELVVLPGQLRIINSATSVADYRVAIPDAVRSVVVMVAGQRVALVTRVMGLDRRIPLK